MARLGVTYQDIANAAEQIKGQGKQPTIELIRNLLGTGSTTTIANHLRNWRAEQNDDTSVAIKENLPPEFISMMKGLWQRLQARADDQVAIVKQESAHAIKQMQLEIDKYKTNNQRWQKLYDGWGKEKELLNQDKLSLQQTVISLQTENAALIAKLDAQSIQAMEKQERIDELVRLHKLAQENLEHYRESTRVQRLMDKEKQDEVVQQLEIALKSAKEEARIAMQDKTALQNKIDKMLYEHQALKNEYDNIKHECTASQTELSKAKKENDDSKREVVVMQKQYEILKKQLDEERVILLEQQKQHAVISQQLIMVRDEVNELKDQNKFIMREKWEIVQEKAQLEGMNKQMQQMIYAKEVG